MTAAASHNGGRSQVNLNFLQAGGDYPFLNCLKTAGIWGFINNADAPVTPDMLDSDGYPTSIVNTGFFTVFYVPTQAKRPGNYVITWTGNGTVYCGMANTPVGGSSKTGSGGSGRYVFSTTADRFVIGISALPVTDLKVYHIDDEADVLAGNIFGAKFKQRLVEGGFGVLRFLNWQKGNGTNVTAWATRKPTSYVFYYGYELKPSLWAGTTTNTGNAYSVSAPPGWAGLVDKATVTVKFNADASAAPCTLNVGGTGAINILSRQSGALAASSYPISGTYKALATLVYDAALNAWIKQGADVDGPQGLDNGVPLELMVQLCAEIGAHPHFISPVMACTPMTDWHSSLATYCRDNGPSWMVPRFEGPNELWNTSGGFYQTGYANAVSSAYGWGVDYQNWYGKAISTIGQAISTVYSNDRTRYQVLCGVQTSTGAAPAGQAASNPRLTSAKYIGTTPQSPYSSTVGVAEAYRWVTHICCAQYISPGLYGTTTGTINEADLATAYAGGDLTAPATYVNSVNPPSAVVTFTNGTPGIVNWTGHGLSANDYISFLTTGTLNTGVTTADNQRYFVKTVIDPDHVTISTTSGGTAVNFSGSATGTAYAFSAFNRFSLPAVAVLYINWKAWAQGFGIQKMCGYEGGYSPDCTSLGNSDADRLRVAGKLVTSVTRGALGLHGFTANNYRNFVGLTDGTFTAEFPSCFQFSGNININGYSTDSWSVLEDIWVSSNPPQFEAIRLFNAGLSRLSVKN